MLKKDSKIKIEMYKEMSDHLYSTLTSCYLPIIGEQAYLFYLSLMSIKRQGFKVNNHLLLQRISNLSFEAMEKARKKCEEFLLLRTYYKEEEDEYLYIIEVPMKASRFLSHEVFGRLFINKMGEDAFTFYKNQFYTKRFNKLGYENISSSMNDTLKNNWDPMQEESFQEFKESAEKLRNEMMNIIFDEKEFLNNLSEMVFPKKERTPSNLRSIAEIATIYGINEKMMRRLIGRGIDVATQTFDVERLRKACMNSKAKYVSDNKDPYKLPPRRFLEYKQNNVSLTQSDVKLIERLLCDYKLQPEVVNVLLEACMNKDKGNAIVATYVERKAAGWARLKIDTLEKAKEQVQKENEVNKKQSIVQHWNVEEEEEISEEERALLIQKIKERGE